MTTGKKISDAEALRTYVAALPAGALALVLVAWAAGSFAGGWVAARIASRRMVPALVVGALTMAAGILNMLMIPHPAWFWAIALVLFLPAAWAGGTVARGRSESA